MTENSSQKRKYLENEKNFKGLEMFITLKDFQWSKKYNFGGRLESDFNAIETARFSYTVGLTATLRLLQRKSSTFP